MATQPDPWTDEIVEEVRRAREKLLAEFDYDIRKLGNWLKEDQKRFGDRLVREAPPEETEE
jgi:hypothetical protein